MQFFLINWGVGAGCLLIIILFFTEVLKIHKNRDFHPKITVTRLRLALLPAPPGEPGSSIRSLRGAQTSPRSRLPFVPAQQSHWAEQRPPRRGKQVPGCQSRTRLEQERTGLNRRWADPSRLARARPRPARPAIHTAYVARARPLASPRSLACCPGAGPRRAALPLSTPQPVTGSIWLGPPWHLCCYSEGDPGRRRRPGSDAAGNNGRGRADGGALPYPRPSRRCHVPSGHPGTGSGRSSARTASRSHSCGQGGGARGRRPRAWGRGGVGGWGAGPGGTFAGARRFPASPQPARAGSPHQSLPKPINAWHRLSNRLTNPAPPIAGRSATKASLRAPGLKSLKLFQP